MNRKIKALGLAFVAALALSAVMASAASAQFTANPPSGITLLHGTQVGSHEFKAGEGFGGITCSTASFSGEQAGTNVSSVTLSPTYAGCKDSFSRTVDIENNSLLYHFTSNGEVHVTGTITLNVTSGGSSVCTVHIKADTITGTGYHNLSGTEPSAGTAGVTVTTKAHGVNSVTSGGFFNCGISNGEHTNGTYTGHTTVTGRDAKSLNPVGISVHGNTEP